MAEDAGLDLKQLASCVKDKNTQAAVEQDRAAAQKKGVNATPTYFINGEMVIGPVNLKSRLDSLLGIEGEK